MEFFKEIPCKFYVLNVHKMGSFTADNLMISSSSSVYDSIVKEPKQKLQTLIEELKKLYSNPKHSFEIHVDYDDFLDAIKQVIGSRKIELIVMGSNGYSNTEEVIFGSNTLKVVRNINCNTLIIPEDFRYTKVFNVLLPLNTSDTVNGSSVYDLRLFMKEHKLNLKVLRVNSDMEHPEFKLFDYSNLDGLNYDYFTMTGIPLHYAVDSFIQLKSIDIAAILVKEEGFFNRLFFGSTMTKLSSHIKLPMLILHND